MIEANREEWLRNWHRAAESNLHGKSNLPLYVYHLARVYFLSLILGPFGFFACITIAGIQWYRQNLAFDLTIFVWVVAALVSPAIAACYRWAFIYWGRRRWSSE